MALFERPAVAMLHPMTGGPYSSWRWTRDNLPLDPAETCAAQGPITGAPDLGLGAVDHRNDFNWHVLRRRIVCDKRRFFLRRVASGQQQGQRTRDAESKTQAEGSFDGLCGGIMD